LQLKLLWKTITWRSFKAKENIKQKDNRKTCRNQYDDLIISSDDYFGKKIIK